MEKLLSNLRDTRIVLASGSPRRQELLSAMGIAFSVQRTDIDEAFPAHLTPAQAAVYIAEKKATAFQRKPGELIITADTLVSVADEILGKPRDRAHAVQLLKKLSGRQHTVYTGVALSGAQTTHSFYEQTAVYFNELDEAEIDYYIEQYQPFDKAGAYGIQEWIGWIGIQKIEGSYSNVMGLPTERLYTVLKNSNFVV